MVKKERIKELKISEKHKLYWSINSLINRAYHKKIIELSTFSKIESCITKELYGDD